MSYLRNFPLKVIPCRNIVMHLEVLLPNKQNLDTCSSHISVWGHQAQPVGQAGVEDCMEKQRDEDDSSVAGTGRYCPCSRPHCLVSSKLGPAIYLGHFWCIASGALHCAYAGTSFEYALFVIKVVNVVSYLTKRAIRLISLELFSSNSDCIAPPSHTPTWPRRRFQRFGGTARIRLFSP